MKKKAVIPATPAWAAEAERVIGQVVALGSGAAMALRAVDGHSREWKRLRRDLGRSIDDATRAAGRIARRTRRYARKHPWQAGAILAAAGLVAAAGAAVKLTEVGEPR